MREDLESKDCDLFPFIGLPLLAFPCLDSLDFASDQAYGEEVWAHTLVPQKLRVGAPDQLIKYEVAHTDELAQAIEAVEERSAPVSKKTKGKHINEILSFDKFYKIKWNVKWIRPTFYSALEVWERKKAAHEDRCFKKYLKAKAINPFIRRKLFMHPFQYPPFPNAQFGIADRLPDPVKGAIPVTITGIASEPQKAVEEWHFDEEKAPKKTKGKKSAGRTKSSSTATLTSKKRNVVEVTSGATEGLAKIAPPPSGEQFQPKRVLPTTEPYKRFPFPLLNPILRQLGPFFLILPGFRDEGPFHVPTSDAGDLNFADDKFNLDSILLEAQEENVPIQTPVEQEVVDREAIIGKVNQVLSYLNHSLEEIVASAEIKAQLLEATSFLNQHASSEVSSLENFMEELFNSHALLESSLEDLRSATAELSKYKKELEKELAVAKQLLADTRIGLARSRLPISI
ncbi:hypothetical protein PIB30_077956 [Stylosanthes scabra]|uniref:Uncharacterized protein n=1 Tax=Stylosanthes scabra TaxID=79078 RepID=A0ABU6VP67_9FABA|nr:hypothetical protein [Stylosanthes scabra]